MKEPRTHFGQCVITPSGPSKLVALIVSPVETVLLSPDGMGPGQRLDPALWAAAIWDPRRRAWIVPDTPGTV